MTDDEIIVVMQAHKEGKQIQYRTLDSHPQWCDVLSTHLGFDFRKLEYRVKQCEHQWEHWRYGLYRCCRCGDYCSREPEPRKPRELRLVYKGSGIWREWMHESGPCLEKSVRFREIIE